MKQRFFSNHFDETNYKNIIDSVTKEVFGEVIEIDYIDGSIRPGELTRDEALFIVIDIHFKQNQFRLYKMFIRINSLHFTACFSEKCTIWVGNNCYGEFRIETDRERKIYKINDLDAQLREALVESFNAWAKKGK